MWAIRLIQSFFSLAMTIGIAGGLIDLTISIAKDSQKAARGGLVSLKSLNQQLHTGKSARELGLKQKRRADR